MADKPKSALSVSPVMLLVAWLPNWKDSNKKVKVVHPNGWVFSLGKFRNAPTEDCTTEDARVRMYIDVNPSVVKIPEKRYLGSAFSDFTHMAFDIDLDDCYLDTLKPLLEWLDRNSAENWAYQMERMMKSYLGMHPHFDQSKQVWIHNELTLTVVESS